jgi:hypothetical protein
MPDIKHSISINAPQERIRSLVSSAAGFAEWWAQDSVQEGDVAELGFFSKNTVYTFRNETSADGVFWRCLTGKEWEGTTLNFRWEPRGMETLLHFVHGDWKAETPYFINCNTTWGELMFRLKAAAEGKKIEPLFTIEGTVA